MTKKDFEETKAGKPKMEYRRLERTTPVLRAVQAVDLQLKPTYSRVKP